MKSVFLVVSLVVSCLTTAGCAQTLSPNVYQNYEVGVAKRVLPGVIIAKRAICIDNATGIGGFAGATTGAVVGSGLGCSGASSIAGAVGGALIAGVIGNEIDKAVNHHQGMEYMIRLKNGAVVSIVQMQDIPFCLHQHVLVIYGHCRGNTRIVPDESWY
jgi:outer membrane lipoprotein SlyB